MTLQTLFRPANNFGTTFSWKIQQDKAVPHCSDQFKRLHLVREWGIPKHSRKMGKKYFARNIKKFIGQISISLLQTQPGIEGAGPWLVCASTRWCQFSETFSSFMIERILVDMNSKEKWQNNGYILQHPWPPWNDQSPPLGSSGIGACNRIAGIQVWFTEQLSDGLAGRKC